MINVGDRVSWSIDSQWTGVVTAVNDSVRPRELFVRWDNDGVSSWHEEKKHNLLEKGDYIGYEMDA